MRVLISSFHTKSSNHIRFYIVPPFLNFDGSEATWRLVLMVRALRVASDVVSEGSISCPHGYISKKYSHAERHQIVPNQNKVPLLT